MTAASSRRAAPDAGRSPGKRNVELQTWLRLLACSNLITAQLRRMLRRDFDISLPTFDILAQIARPPLGPTMGELSKRLMVSKGSVTDLIERLTDQGLVIRNGDSSDARVQRVYLTRKGKTLLDRVLPSHNGLIRRLISSLGPAAVAQLATQLAELRSILRDAGGARRPAKSPQRQSMRGGTGGSAVATSFSTKGINP